MMLHDLVCLLQFADAGVPFTAVGGNDQKQEQVGTSDGPWLEVREHAQHADKQFKVAERWQHGPQDATRATDAGAADWRGQEGGVGISV